jgi:ABC-type multidrug transport system fused ATPase/permease subunit
MYSFYFVYFMLGNFRASRTIHRQLVESIMGTTLRYVPCWPGSISAHPKRHRWLDVTPVSRIITRCTADISAVDSSIAGNFQGLIGDVRIT